MRTSYLYASNGFWLVGRVKDSMAIQREHDLGSGITEGGTQGAFRDVLAKNHSRRGKAPLHLVDMTDEQRKEVAAQLGMPAFRVKQLAQHYFAHGDTDVHNYSDFPARFADVAKEAFFPTLI